MKHKLKLLVCYLLICVIMPINLAYAQPAIDDRDGDGIHIDDIVFYLSHTGSLSNSDIRSLLDQIVPTPTPISTPVHPTNLVATAGDSHISLTWSSVTGATYYNVYQSIDDTNYNLISTPAATTAANYDVTELTNGTLYYFKSTAVNVAGESAYSNSVSAAPIGVPAGYTFCGNEGQTCSFSGTASVAFGAQGVFYYRTFTDGTSCSNEVFGDPLSGTPKSCYYQTSITTGGTVTASGENPNHDEGKEKAFDGTTDTKWYDPTSTGWI